MGLIRAIAGALGGGLADQWLEAYEAADMSDGVVCCPGVRLRQGDKRDSNLKGSSDAISNGSLIHVYDRQAALLVDNGKVVDLVAEPGMFQVDNSSLPSIMTGELKASVKESFNRFRFGGANPTKQVIYFINLQEIKGIKFGTRTPLQYFDNFYNAELFLRAHGSYSIRVTDPILFYQEAIPRDARTVRIEDINEQYISEFLEALQVSINQLSVDGVRISQVTSKMGELSAKMQVCLDEEWNRQRGMEVQAVGIASVSYDDESKELINMRNKGAMLGDPNVREGYVQGSIARGLEAAGSNEAGAAATFMGMGMGMQATGGFMGQSSAGNQAQMERDAQLRQQQAANATAAAGQGSNWSCPTCQEGNAGNFCSKCGAAKPLPQAAGFCSNCGFKFPAVKPRFCPECGQAQN